MLGSIQQAVFYMSQFLMAVFLASSTSSNHDYLEGCACISHYHIRQRFRCRWDVALHVAVRIFPIRSDYHEATSGHSAASTGPELSFKARKYEFSINADDSWNRLLFFLFLSFFDLEIGMMMLSHIASGILKVQLRTA